MLRQLRAVLAIGIVAEPAAPDARAIEYLRARLREETRRVFGRSLHIRQVDAGSCNGCELEIAGLAGPHYDLERFGLHIVASPRHADCLLVTGPVTLNMAEPLRRTWEATPDPKFVIAVGDCGRDAGIFRGSYAVVGGVEAVIPVDAIIPGCPPSPRALLEGLLDVPAISLMSTVAFALAVFFGLVATIVGVQGMLGAGWTWQSPWPLPLGGIEVAMDPGPPSESRHSAAEREPRLRPRHRLARAHGGIGHGVLRESVRDHVSRPAPESRLFISRIVYENPTRSIFDDWLYQPLVQLVHRGARTARLIQSGSANLYLVYILAALVALLVLG
jgi:Ni,Fe-hydrogenase III small subunit